MNEPAETAVVNQFSKWFAIHPTEGITIMDHLFNRLDGAYPHKWRSNFPDPKSVDNWCVSWAEAFEQEGITLNDVAVGLKACRARFEWPPSCAEFIRACRESMDPMKAYYQAVAGCQARSAGKIGEWSHPAIYWASRPLAYDLLSVSYSQIKTRWEMALAEQMAKAAWEEIPKPMPQLSAPGNTELSKEKASVLIKEFKAEDVAKKSAATYDGLRWARQIMKRHEAKDRSIPLISLKNAREVLGMSA